MWHRGTQGAVCMSDIDQLREAFDAGTLLHPSPDIINLVDVSCALANLAGADGVTATPGADSLANLIGPAEHLVFVLADGVGMNMVEQMPGDWFLSRHLVAELRTVFPSTTAVALTTIATGQWPGQHGVTGWWTHIPEIQEPAAIMQFTTRNGGPTLPERGITAEQAYPLPSALGRIRRDTLALFPDALVNGVYSVYFSGGQPRHGYQDLRQAVDLVIERVTSAGHPTYTYLYTPRVDSAVHSYGVNRLETQMALAEVNRELERLAVALGGNSRLVMTSDHGFLDARNGARHQIQPNGQLAQCFKHPPSGDARVVFLHLHPGAEEQVYRYFKERFNERFMLITPDEAEAAGLFGPARLAPVCRERLGDLIAVSAGADVIEYRSLNGKSRIMNEISQHSGLTPDEMRIPLVVA